MRPLVVATDEVLDPVVEPVSDAEELMDDEVVVLPRTPLVLVEAVVVPVPEVERLVCDDVVSLTDDMLVIVRLEVGTVVTGVVEVVEPRSGVVVEPVVTTDVSGVVVELEVTVEVKGAVEASGVVKEPTSVVL